MSDSCVYISDPKFGWLPATVVSQDDSAPKGPQVTVKVFSVDGKSIMGERTVSLSQYQNKQLPLQNVDAAGNLMELPDMVDLPSLHEVSNRTTRNFLFLSFLFSH
jgi:hypothetical protein